MSDRLALANAIEDAGIERGKAQRVASVIFDAIHDNVARKVDVLASETALRADIQALRHDIDAKITGVLADLALIEHRLMTRLGFLAVVLSGIIIAVLQSGSRMAERTPGVASPRRKGAVRGTGLARRLGPGAFPRSGVTRRQALARAALAGVLAGPQAATDHRCVAPAPSAATLVTYERSLARKLRVEAARRWWADVIR
jgi:hypothetical protein